MFWKRTAAGAGIILCLTVLVYLPVLGAGFVWDDDLFLTENPLIRADDGLCRFWCTTEPPDYFPLVSSLLWVEWRLWGLEPRGYHAVNALFHALSSVLLWLVLHRLRVPGAWLAGVLYAVHPVNVESVAWITERKNTQPMVFFLLSILCYLRFEDRRRRTWYFLSLCALLLALLSKTSVVMLPFVLLGCAWWQRGRITGRDLLLVLPFFLMAGALSLVTIWFQYNVAIGDDIVRADGFLSRLAVAGMAVWFYLSKALFPVRLSFVYPRWEVDPSLVLNYVPALMVLLCLAACWRYRQTWGRPLLFGFGTYVITLFPVLGFFDIYFMKYSLVADRWQYTPIAAVIGLLVGLATWSWQLQKKTLRRAGLLVAAAVIAFLCSQSWERCRAFRNAETLWHDTLAKNPSAWMAYNNLGVVLARQGRIAEAIRRYRQALRIKPDFAEAHNNLGYLLVGQGRIEEAVRHCSEALRIRPKYAEAHNNLGIAFATQGKIREAIRQFAAAVRIRPDYADAHNNLGIALTNQGRFEEAIRHHRQSLRINPQYADAHNNLGIAYYRQGKFEEAIRHFSEALRIDPNHASARSNLALALQAAGRASRQPGTGAGPERP